MQYSKELSAKINRYYHVCILLNSFYGINPKVPTAEELHDLFEERKRLRAEIRKEQTLELMEAKRPTEPLKDTEKLGGK